MFKSTFSNSSIFRQHTIRVPITIEEAESGVVKTLKINLRTPCPQCNIMTRSHCLVCKGTGLVQNTKTKTFKFDNITQKIQMFRFPNFVNNTELIIKTVLQDTEDFKFKDKVTVSFESINIFKAILGGKTKVKTLKGMEEIELPPNQIRDFQYILRGKGFKGNDQITNFKLFLPKELTDKQKKLLNSLVNEEKD